MATLEKIRSKGTLLLIVVGSALFAFIIGDFLNSSSSYFGQSKMNVIEIGDEKVKIDEYQAKIDELTKVYQIQMNQTQLSEEMTEQIRQSTYDNIIREKLIKKATGEVGMVVESKELFDMVSGNNIHPYITSLKMFYNPNTGAFDKTYLLNFLKSLNTPAENAQQQEQIDQAKTFWLFWENLVKNTKLEEKYVALLTKSLNTNSLESKFSFENRKNTVDLTYVLKPYSSIADASISVSDEELKKEYELKKERYKQEASRDIKFISFNISPSKDDFAKIEDWINKQKEEFTTSPDVADLVNSVSDVTYPTSSVSDKDVDPDFKSFAFSGKKNDVMGPILANNTYKMARIIENGISAPDSVSIRHILVFDKDEVTTEVLADSIVNALKQGANFEALVKKYSKNTNTAANGGKIGWVKEQNIDKEMIEPCFYGTKGNLFSVKTNNGTHVIEVLEKTKNVNKVKVAVLQREVSASTNTYSKLYNDAKEYIAKNNSLAKFESTAEKQGYVVRPYNGIKENDTKIGTLQDSRKVVRWIFENDAKTISDVFVCGDEFVIAAITKVNEKGYKPMDDVKTELKAGIITDKKADIIEKDLAKELSSKKSLQEISTALSLPVDTLTSINFIASNGTKIGNEPEIIAVAPYMKKDELSAPLKGKAGVFVINVYNVVQDQNVYNEQLEKNTMNSKYTYTVPQSFIEVLKDKAELKDNRSRFF